MAAFVDRFLHRRYTEITTMETVTDRSSPILGMIQKPIRGGGSINDGVRWAGPQGFSFDLFAAQQVAGQVSGTNSDMNGQYDEYNLPFGEYHGSVQVSSKGLAGSKGRENAYLEELASAMDVSLEAYGSIAARKIFGPVGGSIGTILAMNAGGTAGEISITVKNDAFNFVPGMILNAADPASVTNPTVRAGQGFVFEVYPDGDTDTTVLAVATTYALSKTAAGGRTGTVGTPSGWVNGDNLFRNGDVRNATDLSDRQIRSLQGFITLAQATDTYLGLPRAPHGGLSGFRLSAAAVAGVSVKERIERLVNQGRKQYNARNVDVIGVGPDTWMELSQDVQDTGWQNFGKVMESGAGEIVINSANGLLKVVNEPHIREADIWALTMKDLKIFTYDGFPGVEEGDGLKLLRMPAISGQSPQLEVRWRAYNCLSISGSPWHFGRTVSDVVSL